MHLVRPSFACLKFSLVMLDSATMKECELECVKHQVKVDAENNLNCQFGLRRLLHDYCSNSTIHGIKYFGCKQRTILERAWWITVFLLSVFGCGQLIINIYHKWDQNPVILTFNERSTPVWQIPFPAVTICPETKSKAEILNFTEAYHALMDNETEMDDESFNRLRALAQICDAHLLSDVELNQTHDRDCVDYIRNMSVPINEMLMFCKWGNIMDYCDELFSESLTDYGLCYTFNVQSERDMLKSDQMHSSYTYITENRTSIMWSLEKGYSKEATLDVYPNRAMSASPRSGLNVLLRSYDNDLDYLCRGPVQGFTVLLHTPSDYPQVSRQYLRVPPNQEVILMVKPKMITTSDNLKDYDPYRRQCFFNHERRLKFFQVYTQRNYDLECLANYTLQACGCVKFSMPRDEQTEVCGASMIECYNKAEDALLEQEVKFSIDKSYDFRAKCDCLPSCTSIQYDAEISQADFNFKDLFLAYKEPIAEFAGVQLSRLTIYLKETQFITSKRSELYGMTDFLANCGGLLGLFMGVSLLSLVEILYFCLIRPCSIMRSSARSKQAESTFAAKGDML